MANAEQWVWVQNAFGLALADMAQQPAGTSEAKPEGARKPVSIADRRAAAKRCLQIWLDAKETADAGLGRLKGSLSSTKDPIFLRIADRGLNGVTGRLQVGLRVGLEEFARETDPNGGAADKLLRSVEAFSTFLEKDRAVQLCDDNPFNVDVSLRSTLGQALRQIDQELKSVVG